MLRNRFGLGAVIILLSVCRSDATVHQFVVSMSGAQEFPGPGDPDGSGTAFLAIDDGTSPPTISWNIQVNNIQFPTTGAHIHQANAGAQGPVRVDFSNQLNGAGLQDTDLNGVLANPTNWYVNVHNSPFPGGAIRGQIGPSIRACCMLDGSCTNLSPSNCGAAGGEPGGPGSLCAGDADGDGIDNACGSAPCDDCATGPHWIHTPGCPPGQDVMNSGALVGIDLDLDCVRDQNLILSGPVGVRRGGPIDDSGNFPGTRPVDGHLDVIDTEMVALTLTGGGVTLTAGAGRGAIPLSATKGNVAEQPGNPGLADSFFDVFFEVDLGGGNRLYNQSPLRAGSTISCLPPTDMYFHPTGICIPLYTSPITGQGVHVANLVSARHDPFPQPGACCLPGDACIETTSVDCGAQGGEFQGEGSVCGPAVCVTVPDQPCSDGGPGPHWVDTTPAGNDSMPTGALVGLDTDLDCVRDQNLVMFGPASVNRTNPLDDSNQYPGTRPIDGHLDVIDTEMVSLSLTGGGVTLTAGAGMGAIPLAATLGNIAEQPGDPSLADSFFDVFFEVDLGGGNRVYNQSALRVQAVIDCVPPTRIYFHPVGICIPLYTSPVPGQGVHVANLVSANHDPFPQPGACCLPGGVCTDTTSAECEAQGGQFQGEGSVCGPTTCASCVPPGQDCWSTACGGTRADFADNPIPAGFFDPGSQPFDGLISLGGSGGLDTVMQRLGPLCFPDPLPSTDSTPIELVQLNLVSCAPITVQGSGQWDVQVGLAGQQPTGSLIATKTHPNGGTFSAQFFVQPVYTFTRVGNPGDVRVFDTLAQGIPPLSMETAVDADWSTSPAFDVCSPGDGFSPGVGEDGGGQPCCEETCHGTSGDPTPCDPSGGHCHCTEPRECPACPPGVPAANVVSAISRRSNPRPGLPGGVCDTNLLPPRSSEPHQGGVQQIRIGFNVAPGGGGGGAALEQSTCASPPFVPYAGVSIMSGSVVGNELVLTFAPGLENARSYRITLGPAITSVAGQFVEVRGLSGDVNNDGLVNATDRSVVVSAWTGVGFSCATDLNNDGSTNATDRSIVVSAWTGGASTNCAP